MANTTADVQRYLHVRLPAFVDEVHVQLLHGEESSVVQRRVLVRPHPQGTVRLNAFSDGLLVEVQGVGLGLVAVADGLMETAQVVPHPGRTLGEGE